MMRRTVVYLVAVANTTFKARPISYNKKEKRKEKTDKQAKLIVGESKLAPLYPVFGSLVKTDKLCVCFTVMGHCLSFRSLFTRTF